MGCVEFAWKRKVRSGRSSRAKSVYKMWRAQRELTTYAFGLPPSPGGLVDADWLRPEYGLSHR